MTFRAFRATPFSHTHENIAFNQLHDLLEMQWAREDDPLYLFGNFYVDGGEIDALIVKRNAIIVIDFKDYGGKLTFSENGRWLMNGREVRGGSKANPYQQIRDNKFQLLNYLKEHVRFQSDPQLGHIAGLCLFHQPTEFDRSTLPINISRWFHVADMRSIVRTVDAIVSSSIQLSETDLNTFIRQLDVPTFQPDGRAAEELIAPITVDGEDIPKPLNQEQQKALVALNDWIHDEQSKVFAVAGPYYSGKEKLLTKAIEALRASGKRLLFLAPNSRIANRHKMAGFSDVSSIYSWLYAGQPSKVKDGKAFYPISHDPINSDSDVIIIFDAHLLGDDKYETETAIYGSGFVLRDLLGTLTSQSTNPDEQQTPLELSGLGKIFLIGDPYQLTRGARDRSLLSCSIFQQFNVKVTQAELNSQDRDEFAPTERLDFQKVLLEQLKAGNFLRLPVCEQGSIKAIKKGDDTDSIATALQAWPRRAAYLCATHEIAQKVNQGIRKKYLKTTNSRLLVEGDIIDLHSRTLDLKKNEFEQIESGWVHAGEFAKVLFADSSSQARSVYLKGRDNPVTVDFANATIEYNGGIAEICYLPEFLGAVKPELSQDQQLALQIWAKEEATYLLGEDKGELDQLEKGSPAYAQAFSRYKEKLEQMIMLSRYTNVARLRFAYALTVHRAQAYEPVETVILDGSRAHDTENPATDSYFRWLYTATTCTSEAIRILDFCELSPLSQAKWHFDSAQIKPLKEIRLLNHDKKRKPLEHEKDISLPSGFTNGSPELVAVFLTILERLNGSNWSIEDVLQEPYCERYIVESVKGKVEIKLHYKKTFDVTIGAMTVLDGDIAIVSELSSLLSSEMVFQSKVVESSVQEFAAALKKKNWFVTSIAEKPYKAYLIIKKEEHQLKVEVNIPKSGLVSSIKVVEAATNVALTEFRGAFEK